jgi:hypothetical protein
MTRVRCHLYDDDMTDRWSALQDVVHRAGGPDGRAPDDAELLDALVALHALRDELADWEPRLIDAAREEGVSWARLAPALGVTSRQAAERRYLRLAPGGGEATAEQRVQATRDRRAQDRAVDAWARENAGRLRRVAARIAGLEGLEAPARRHARQLTAALGDPDPTALLAPLTAITADLAASHPEVASELSRISAGTDRVRRDTHDDRRRSA